MWARLHKSDCEACLCISDVEECMSWEDHAECNWQPGSLGQSGGVCLAERALSVAVTE
jgi:hypothetical protein